MVFLSLGRAPRECGPFAPAIREEVLMAFIDCDVCAQRSRRHWIVVLSPALQEWLTAAERSELPELRGSPVACAGTSPPSPRRCTGSGAMGRRRARSIG